MYIESIKITNFKSHKGQIIKFKIPDQTQVGSGLNILVGENNSGKSTVFEAISFLRDGTKKDLQSLVNKSSGTSEFTVELTFSGDINNVIDDFSQENKKATFKKYVYQEDGTEKLSLLRSSSNPKEIKLLNKATNEYKNEAGIDAPIKKLFEANFIWADTNPNDEVSFGATTICGNLLKEITKSFEGTPEYEAFSKNFDKTFNDEASGLRKQLKQIEDDTQKIFGEQFGKAKISFHFEELKIDAFFKNTKIRIDDGNETEMGEKGSGMQRCVALALLQVYAKRVVAHPEKTDVSKPFFLFIDEPEICLHPQGQKKMLNAMKVISKQRQVFVTTHSPYFVDASLLPNVYKFVNDDVNLGTTIFCDKDNKLTVCKENRVFFFHHKDLFFTTKAIFVEGATDLERLSLYCDETNNSNLVKDIFFLAGKNDSGYFKTFCGIFNIKCFFIYDCDFINPDLNKYRQEVIDPKTGKKVMENQDKEWHRKNFVNYESDFLKKKTELLKENIFLLSRPDIMDFLDENGKVFEGKNSRNEDIIGTVVDKEKELQELLNLIK